MSHADSLRGEGSVERPRRGHVHPCDPGDVRSALRGLPVDAWMKGTTETQWPSVTGYRVRPPALHGLVILDAALSTWHEDRLDVHVHAVPTDLWPPESQDRFVHDTLPRVRAWSERQLAGTEIERTEPVEFVVVLNDGRIEERELPIRHARHGRVEEPN